MAEFFNIRTDRINEFVEIKFAYHFGLRDFQFKK